MKKLILTLGLVTAVTGAYAQGTINFQNGTLSKLSLIVQNSDGTFQSPVVLPTTSSLNFGVFYGTSAGSLTLAPTLIPNSTVNAGILNVGTAFPIPLSAPADAQWFVQIKGWSSSFGTDWATAFADFTSQSAVVTWGASPVINGFNLGPTAGPGYAIWQSATGSNPAKINAFSLTQCAVVPEPTTMALAGLGVAAMLIFRRRK